MSRPAEGNQEGFDMKISVRQRRKKAGLAGGTLVPEVVTEKEKAVTFSIFHFDESGIEEKAEAGIADLKSFRERPGMTWIDVNGVHDTGLLEEMGSLYGLHSLVMEDIADTSERPKVDDYEDYLYVTLKMVWPGRDSPGFRAEQASFILGSNYLISFQEFTTDPYDPVRIRLRGGKGRIRREGPDFLMYALVDAVVDSYYAVLEDLGEDLEKVEENLVRNPSLQTFREIHDARQTALMLRRFAWPMRDMLASLERSDSELIRDTTKFYLRDVYDHSVEILDIVENSRDVCSSLLDVYLSSQSNRLNEVMKVLTVIATIFMPLSWIAGVYGMNFENMPELKAHYGYPLSLVVMFGIALGMVIYFRRREWL